MMHRFPERRLRKVSVASVKEAPAASVPREIAGKEEPENMPTDAGDGAVDAKGTVADSSKGTTTSGNNPSVEGKSKVAVPGEASAGDQQVEESLKVARTADVEKVEGSQGEGKTAAGVGPQGSVKDSGVVSRHDESPKSSAMAPSDFKAIAAASAADASVFTFGDNDDYDSEKELH